MGILGTLKVMLTADTGKFAQDMKSGRSEVSAFKKEFSNMAKGLVGGLGLAALGKGILDVANETAAYAKTVEDLSRSLGVNTEEASKLIQMTDDLEISQSALEMGMKTALRQGITPNIEGIKGLAEKYQALNTPAEKASFALKTFGKNGLEMAKILEKTPDQIQEMADALEGSSLIMGKDAVKAAKDYRLALDEAQDEITAAKIALGNELLPVMIKGIGVFNKGTSAGFELAGMFGTIVDLVRQRLSPAYADQVKLTSDLNNMSLATPPNIRAMTSAVGELAQSEEELKKSADEAKKAHDELNKAADEAKKAHDALKFSIIEVSKAAMGREMLDALKKAYDDGAISAEEYKARTGLVMSTWLEMPATEVSAGQALTLLKKDFDDGKISIYEYLGGLAGIRTNLDMLNGKRYTTYYDIVTSGTNYHYTPPIGGGGGGGGGTPASTSTWRPRFPGDVPPGGQHGLDMIVPGGYPNDSYPVRATSGERVTITPKGGATNDDIVKAILGLRELLDPKGLARSIRDAVLKVV